MIIHEIFCNIFFIIKIITLNTKLIVTFSGNMNRSIFQIQSPQYEKTYVNQKKPLNLISANYNSSNDQLSSQGFSDTTRKINHNSEEKQIVQQELERTMQSLIIFDKRIDHEYQSYNDKLKNYEQSEIMFGEQNITSHEQKQKLKSMKEAMNKILSFEEEKYQNEKFQFLQKNGQLQKQITIQIENIDALDREIDKYTQYEEEQIISYEKKGNQLKKILKKKGEIQEVERKQEQVRQKLVDVRKTREMLQSLKDKKKNRTQSIVDKLEELNQYRRKIIDLFRKRYWNAQEPHLIHQKIRNFVGKMEQLKSLKQQELEQEQKQNMQILSGRSNIRNRNNSLRNSLNLSKIAAFECNSPSAALKPVHQLKTSLPPSGTFEIDQKQVNLNTILDKYREIIAAYNQVQKLKDEYVNNRLRNKQRKCQIKLLQKIYLKGIINIHPQELASQQYINFINETIFRCNKFMRISQMKQKQVAMLLGKVHNISETQKIFLNNIQKIQNQSIIKKKIYKQIENILKTAVEEQKISSMKNCYKQVEKLKIKLGSYQKDLQQFAQTTNLQGYKQTKIKISELQEEIAEAENKSKFFSSKKYDLGEYFKQIYQVLEKCEDSSFISLIDKIKSKDPAQALAKANRRLLSL